VIGGLVAQMLRHLGPPAPLLGLLPERGLASGDQRDLAAREEAVAEQQEENRPENQGYV
jgi:hypothetical protein